MRPFTLCSVKDIKSASFFCTKGCGDVAACLRRRGKCGVCAAAPHSPIFFPGKENGRCDRPKERRFPLQSGSSKSCNACRLHCPERGVAAFEAAIRFASAPTTRCCAAVGGSAALRMLHTPCGCRSDSLVVVQPNFRLTEHSTMRRAKQCRIPHAVCRRENVTRASRQ